MSIKYVQFNSHFNIVEMDFDINSYLYHYVVSLNVRVYCNMDIDLDIKVVCMIILSCCFVSWWLHGYSAPMCIPSTTAIYQY